MKKLRQSTIEPVFGSLVQHYGLRKINGLGKSGAHKVMLLAAVAFNLKKYMKCKPARAVSMAQVLEKGAFVSNSFTFLLRYETETPEASVKL
ncbi:transposase [Pontibacter sp. Tf4]|uniref:transposase n=1 Tax=Pontibacter sp. Tf4 TaxID=2761620 RepID=UPI001C88E3BA|nr:transposase [Pontibacter sp. Tf4]